MNDFEYQVLDQLSKIRETLATTAQAQVDHTRRIAELERYNDTQESRHWLKSVIVGAIIVVAHPLARKLGWDI